MSSASRGLATFQLRALAATYLDALVGLCVSPGGPASPACFSPCCKGGAPPPTGTRRCCSGDCRTS
eukprot:1882132-Prymnesium_polylepis.1